jgi:hypothetical protein
MIMPVYSVTTDTPEIVFSDVQPGQWFYDDVITLANKGVITGVTTPVNGVGRYNPQGIVTLGEFLAISTRLVAKQYVMEIPGEKNWAGPYYSTAVDFSHYK